MYLEGGKALQGPAGSSCGISQQQQTSGSLARIAISLIAATREQTVHDLVN
jgi:hypothetical protein